MRVHCLQKFSRPNSPNTHPSSPGVKSIALGEGNVMSSGYFSNLGIESNGRQALGHHIECIIFS